MSKADKFWYIVGGVIGSFSASLVAPEIATYFYALVSSEVIAASGIVALTLKFVMAKVTTSERMLKFFRKYFYQIVLIDCTCGAAISALGLMDPAIRFIGLAAVGAVSTYLWIKLMRNLAARRISGDELTILNSLSEYYCFGAGLLGCIIAYFMHMNAETAVIIQALGTCLMGATDMIAFKRLKKED